ncbi:MAG TPA: NAD(P)-dependent oxidoreductase [Nitrososphaera sp.]|nr:NAD(P)-dependent oxidoreductase [Nitrososphaera sp.]
MNILVTGASGFIGTHLVKKLAANPAYKVSVLTRKQGSISPTKDANVTVVECNILDSNRLKDIGGITPDVVIHLAAIKEHFKSKDTIFSTNVEGTKNILERFPHVKQFVFSSSTLVSSPSDAYSESKRQCEAVIKESGVNHTILRIAPVFGAGDRTNLTRLIELIRNGKTIPIPGDGKQMIQPTHVDDVVRAMESSIMNQEYFNKTLVIAGNPITLKGFIDSVSKIVDRNPKRIHIPIGLLKPMVKVYQKMSDTPKITVEQLDNLGKLEGSKVFDSDFPTSRIEIAIQKTVNHEDTKESLLC